MKVAVIDGQGGGIGKAIVERFRQNLGNEIEIIALGTNAIATNLMLKAGANEGASGENAIRINALKVDFIVGSIGIITANSMLGELTPIMAMAISDSPAQKLLIPLNRCNIHVVGTKNEPLPHFIEEAIAYVKESLRGERNV